MAQELTVKATVGYAKRRMQEENASAQMREGALALARAVYRVTQLFPAEEPLRQALRAKAIKIVEAAAENEAVPKRILEMTDCLTIAREMKMASPVNFLVLEREYNALAQSRSRDAVPARIGEHEKEKSKTEERLPPYIKEEHTLRSIQSIAHPEINERKQAILERLHKTGRVKASDFYKILSGVSPKTIQRDLAELAASSIIKREGDRRWTVYVRNDVR